MVGSVRECSGRFGRVRSTVSWRSVVSVCVRECLGWFGRVVQSVSVQECSGRLGRLSGSPRAGSVAAEGRTRSGASDAEVYASPRTNHRRAHPLALDVGKHRPARRFVVDKVQWPPQVELGQEHLTPRSTLRRGPIMGAAIQWYSTWGTTTHQKRHLLPSVQCDAPV